MKIDQNGNIVKATGLEEKERMQTSRDIMESIVGNYRSSGTWLYPDLFGNIWQQQWLHDTFLTIIAMLKNGKSMQDIIDAGHLTKEHDNVYSFPTFTREICDMLIAETKNFIKYCEEQNVEVHRPNSMNKYGIILNLMGMRQILTNLQQTYLWPISKILFPIEASSFTDDHHSFIVSYAPDKDRALDMHTDDSDVTWNICLGCEGFEGSGLTFCGMIALAEHRQFTIRYTHQIGRAVVHLGQQRHGADIIQRGERHNLIIWCKNEEYRQSDLFQERMHAYEKEGAPPDARCLSYTHDRDFAVYKRYPPGTNPYTFATEDDSPEEADMRMLPWCPPQRFAYDNMPTMNKILLHAYEQIVEEEEKVKAELYPTTINQEEQNDVSEGNVSGQDVKKGHLQENEIH